VSGRAVMIDGVIVDPAHAKVSVYDRGFLYGDAVFEVLRTYGGAPFALEAHVGRLGVSAAAVGIVLPVEQRRLQREIEQALGAAGNEESYVRVMVTRGEGPLSLDPDTAQRPLRVLLVEPLRPPPRDDYANGIAAITLRARRAVDDTSAAGAKVTNYLANLLAVREAKARGAREALIVDGRGHVVEGASSNVFVVRSGRVATPPEQEGILAGITRAGVLAAAAKLGMEVDQRALEPEDLYAADEVFVTSSIRELLSVVRVDGRPVGDGAPGPVARALHRRFRQDAGVGASPMPWV